MGPVCARILFDFTGDAVSSGFLETGFRRSYETRIANYRLPRVSISIAFRRTVSESATRLVARTKFRKQVYFATARSEYAGEVHMWRRGAFVIRHWEEACVIRFLTIERRYCGAYWYLFRGGGLLRRVVILILRLDITLSYITD